MSENLYYGYSKQVHELAENYIERDILYCASMMVEDMLKHSYDVSFINEVGFNYDNIENLYTQADGEEEPQEIYEWWQVSDWLYSQLNDLGEPILSTNYGFYWGRTCTGQSIILDGTIQEIAKNYI